MGATTRAGSRAQGIAGAGAGPALALAAVALLACASERGPGAPPGAAAAAAALRATPAPEGAVVVRLAFGAGADLDLYVTGPRQETVYFANTPSRIGGRLEADLRCDAPAPRVETVVFPYAWPGHYRVGVDHPESCEGGGGPAGFVVETRSAAGRQERTGVVAPGEFQPIVLEWLEPEAP